MKIKKDYLEGATDSLDLVPIAAYFGKGKRTGVYGGFLLACYNDTEDTYQTITKIGTGFSDEDLVKWTEKLKETVLPSPPNYFDISDSNKPDVWFEPTYVWEIRAADLSLSPAYMAAIGIAAPDRGISLRFPRFLRLREDKAPSDATNADQVVDMYYSQSLTEGLGTKSAAKYY
uniref:ATP-dependent DNA ligase family profile domain-containing protein n=1 Tax=Paramoeba aestuarina TaxID=180227 RepID=A0A7S4PA64_9EUKA